ncbi:translation initiation factor 2 [Lysinibacillus sp. 2017]|uniref:translation initiation factor 2 n=1 Tax=unclassified Lysinibacillus TaxID=2636778 RepID=UPI000D52746E|nr:MULTISPECIES: translation initiation factor 2 [unclassified Lysinibacillus]AWE07650.1 translation initiation factor 2 [Lysinibacillus sp. 2017]TGN36812.1 translation initiation factor 2 [Lysinibacillus sp. S2017]
MSNKNNKLKQSSDSFDIQVARLVYIGSTISTLGGGLQTIAAALALSALEKASSESFQSQYDQSKQPEDLEMQIDSIIKELKQIKKIIS